MIKLSRSVDETLSPTQGQRVDRACDRFEAAWREGRQPRIESYLEEFAEAGPEQTALLRELLFLELQIRQRRGEQPARGEYEARFPGHAHLIDEVFRPGQAGARHRDEDPDRTPVAGAGDEGAEAAGAESAGLGPAPQAVGKY